MHYRRNLLVLALVAVVVHAAAVGYVWFRFGRIDAHAFQSLDCGEYYTIARNLAEHGAFSQSESPPLTPDSWRTPGYPLFLAGAMLVGAGSPGALILIQQFLAILSVLLAYRIASAHLRPWTATLAALLFLLEPYHLFYSFWLLSTTFFTFVLLATWLVWEHVRAEPRLGYVSLLGLLAGFLVLTWPGAILIPLFLIAAFMVMRWQGSDTIPLVRSALVTNRWLAFALLAATSALFPAFWMARNKIVAGQLALSHQSGIVLAYFKATEVELWRQGRTEDRYVETSLNPENRDSPHTVWDHIDERLRRMVLFDCSPIGEEPAKWRSCNVDEITWANLAQGNKTSNDSFAMSRRLAGIGTSMLKESPLSTGACWIARIGENLAFPLGLAIDPPRGAPVHRLKAGVLGTLYSFLTSAALVGMVRATRQWRTTLFPIACIIALALTTAPQIDPRFRVPMIPLLAFLALLPFRRGESAESGRARPR